MKIIGIIPARYASTRFPGKPLALIKDKSLLERVWRQAKRSKLLSEVIVATDDIRIKKAAEAFGARVAMTSRNCKSGTDRLAQAIMRSGRGADIVINIQGDEPLIPPSLIDKIADSLIKDPKLSAATAAFPIRDKKEIENPNVVKVVFDRKGNALYFSRCPIPYPRRPKSPTGRFKHIGIYGYRKDFLLRFAGWGRTPIEKTEELEQLRILERGVVIKVVISNRDSFGVDVPSDIKKIERLIK